MNKNFANANFTFLYVVISAVAVGCSGIYSLITGLAWWQTALVMIGGLLGAWAILFTFLELRRVAQTQNDNAQEAPNKEENPYVSRTIVVLPSTGMPYPHHEDYPESAGLTEEQLVSRLPNKTPIIEDYLDRHAKEKQTLARQRDN